MLWWAVRVYVAVDPASSRKQDGEYVSRRTERGSPPEQVPVRDRQVGVEHDDVARDPLAVGGVHRDGPDAPASRRGVTSVPYRITTPCFSAAPASARGTACMPPRGKNTPATESM